MVLWNNRVFHYKVVQKVTCAHHNSPHVNYAQWHFNGLFKVNEWDLLVKIFVCEQAYRQESPKSSASQCSSKESPGIQSDSFIEACRRGLVLTSKIWSMKLSTVYLDIYRLQVTILCQSDLFFHFESKSMMTGLGVIYLNCTWWEQVFFWVGVWNPCQSRSNGFAHFLFIVKLFLSFLNKI